MTILRCAARLLKRLHQPAKPPEPAPQGNPLGEWYADVDFWDRRPFVVMLNGMTGAVLVLNGSAAGLRVLHERALLQFASLCEHFGIHGARGCRARRFRRRIHLRSSLNERKHGAWMAFEHSGHSLVDAARVGWDGLFRHPALGRNLQFDMEYHRPLDLLRQRLA